MESIHLNMGEIIREMRKGKSLTQDALAQAVGVSVQAVSKWETSQSLPDITLLPAIADFFEISMDTLFGRESSARESEPDPVKEESPVSFPDDDKLRVVQFMGSRLMSSEECADGKAIPLAIDKFEGKLDMEIQGSARINGAVNGVARTAGDIFISGSVNGSANAEGDIHCEGNINGSARAAGSVNSRNQSFTGSDVGETVRATLKDSLSGVGNILSSMFGNRRTGGAVGAHMNAFFSGQLPDDDVLRVIQMQGRRILTAEESAGAKVIRLSVEHLTGPLNVEVYGSADIRGSVGGNATAGDSMNCGPIGGNASAGDSMTCGTVGGYAKAGDSIRVTGDVGGSVSAGDSVTCGNVMGDITGAAEVHCGSAQNRSGEKRSKFRAGASFSSDDMPDFSGTSFRQGVLNVVQVMDGKVLSCEESRKDRAIRLSLEDADSVSIEVHGDAIIDGDVQGNVSAGGSVTCDAVEGDVAAGAQVTCDTVEGDVSAGAQVTCDTVEGDVSAGAQVTCDAVEGNVTAGGSVSCGDIGGDVRIEGSNSNASLECGNIGGSLAAKGAAVYCGEIWGNTSIEGSNSNASLECGNIGGSLAATGAAVSCGDIEGDATVENASLRYGSVGGTLHMNNSNISPNE